MPDLIPFHLESWLSKLGLSKRTVASELKVSAQSVSNWTRGKNASWPPLSFFLRLKESLPAHLDIDYLEDCWLLTRRWWLDHEADETEKAKYLPLLQDLEKSRPFGKPAADRAVERQSEAEIRALEKRPGVYDEEIDEITRKADLSFFPAGAEGSLGTHLPSAIASFPKEVDAILGKGSA